MPSLSDHRKKLREYIKIKEERSSDDISTRVGRNKKRGYVTSFFPIISMRRIFSNYAEEKGGLYKMIHPRAPYISGRPVLFPKARNFFGAKRKDRKLASSKRGIISRVHNVGDAQYLTRIIDNIEKRKKEGEKDLELKLYDEVYQQILYKKSKKVSDSYLLVLEKIFDNIDTKEKQKIIKKYEVLENVKTLKEKRNFLNWSAENTNPSDYTRGEDYSFDRLKEYTGYIDRKTNFDPILQHLKSKPSPVGAKDIITPQEGSFKNDSPPIDLPGIPRLFDKAMHMRLKSNANYFSDYSIKGKVEKNNTSAIVGKDNKPLENGWYQFVIMNNDNNAIPEIRYYPCGEKQDGRALYEQINQIRNEDYKKRTGKVRKYTKDYIITSPLTHPQKPNVPELRYDKYVAHSQLAGGKAVLSGGAFMVVDGKVEIVEDSSGHYASEKGAENEYSPIDVAYKAFNCFGILGENCAFERWDPYKGIDKLFKKTAGALKNPFAPPKILNENPNLIPLVAENRPVEPNIYKGQKNLTPAQTMLKRKQIKEKRAQIKKNSKNLKPK